MKNIVATILVSLLMYNVAMSQKLEVAGSAPEDLLNEYTFNQTIGSFHGVLYATNIIKGDLYVRGFEEETYKPLFNNRVDFLTEGEAESEIQPLEIVMSSQGLIFFGYLISKDFSEITFYGQRINDGGQPYDKPVVLLKKPYSKKVFNQEITVFSSTDLTKVGLSFLRKTGKQNFLLADIIVFDPESQEITKMDRKFEFQDVKSNDYEFRVFLRNSGQFITVFEENIYSASTKQKHHLNAFTFDENGTEMDKLNLKLESYELYKPYFSEKRGDEGFAVSGFFIELGKLATGFQGVSNIEFTQEDFQRKMEVSSHFSTQLLDKKLGLIYDNNVGLNRRYNIDNAGQLANGQNYVSCSYLEEQVGKKSISYKSGSILIVSYGRERELNFETVIETPMTEVSVNASSINDRYISYPNSVLKENAYQVKVDHKNIYVLYKELDTKVPTEEGMPIPFNTQIVGKSINEGEADPFLMKDFYEEDQYLFFLKSYTLFNSERLR